MIPELTLDLNPQFCSHVLLLLIYICMVDLGDTWQDFTFVPV